MTPLKAKIYTKEDLKLMYKIKASLEKFDYPSSNRVAEKILEFTRKEGSSIESIIERLKNHEPWEYICNKAEFYENEFYVDNNVLIPRVETEQLIKIAVEEIIKIFNSSNFFSKGQSLNCLDIGTGSGAIIISIAKALEAMNSKRNSTSQSDKKLALDFNTYSSLKILQSQINFAATDISENALKIVRQNAKNIISSPIRFLKSDLLTNVPRAYLTGSFVLVANLPYIPEGLHAKLQPSVREWEPRNALIGGKSGHEIYEKLFIQIAEILKVTRARKDHIAPSKKDLTRVIIIEIDPSMKDRTVASIKTAFPEAKLKIYRDCNNIERFIRISLYEA